MQQNSFTKLSSKTLVLGFVVLLIDGQALND